MGVGRARIVSFALGVVSALTVALIGFCVRGSSAVWPATSLPEPVSYISVIDAINETSSLNSSKIPHILHQSWVNRTVPQHFSAWRQSWVTNHKHWQFKLWTDDDNDELVKQYAPWFLARYEGYEAPVMRADSVRHLYMYR